MTCADLIACAREEIEKLPAELLEELAGLQVYAVEEPSAADGFHDGALAGAYVEREPEGYMEPERELWLFRANIKPLTRDSVELIVWHELGHALGLDEAEVHALGLGV